MEKNKLVLCMFTSNEGNQLITMKSSFLQGRMYVVSGLLRAVKNIHEERVLSRVFEG